MTDIAMSVGARVWDSIIASDYGTSTGSNIAQHMRTALYLAPAIDLNLGHGRHVAAIADCWLDLATYLGRNSRHGHDADPAERARCIAWARLAGRIDKELRKLANHPAYKGVGVMGIDRTVLAAWRCGTKYFTTARDAIVSHHGCPTPEFGYLIPESGKVRNRFVTRWTFTTSESLELAGSGSPPSAPPA